MRDDLGKFGGLDAMVERQLHLLLQQHRLVTRDQSRDSDETAVTGERPGRFHTPSTSVSC